MGLGLKTTTGEGDDFLNRIQYDAKAGRFFRVDRMQNAAGDWQNNLEELPLPFRVMIDFENIEVGWIRLDGAVDFCMTAVGQDIGPQPSPKHRQGFRATIYSKTLGLRNWNHTAKCVLAIVDLLYERWETDRSEQRGMVPVVEFTKVHPITTGTGQHRQTNYEPEARVVDWQPRDKMPVNGDGEVAASPPAAPAMLPAPAATTPAAPTVPPPQTAPAAAPAMAGEEF